MLRVLIFLASFVSTFSLRTIINRPTTVLRSLAAARQSGFVSERLASDNKGPKSKEPQKEGLERLLDLLDKADKDPKKSGKPPIYEPGGYQYRALAALPSADAADPGAAGQSHFPEYCRDKKNRRGSPPPVVKFCKCVLGLSAGIPGATGKRSAACCTCSRGRRSPYRG